jgi:ribosomal protein S18 acetylase RimI-like enzyme
VIATRLATARDVAAIARLHCLSFPESLAARLGPTWIAATYDRLLRDPTARLHVAPDAHPSFIAVRLPPPPEAELPASRPLPLAAALAHLLRTGQLPAWLASAAALALHDLRGRGAPRLPAGAASIDYVAVAPGHRRRGIAHALVAAALADPTAADLSWVVGTTADNAPALALYARHDFAPRERWTGYDGRPYVRLHRRPKR